MLEKRKEIRKVLIKDTDLERVYNLREQISKLGNSMGAEVSGKRDALLGELSLVLNRLSDEKFLDRRNVSHVVNAGLNAHKIFDIDGELNPEMLEEYKGSSYFHFSIGGNPYVQFDKSTIIIFSPENKLLVRLLRKYMSVYGKEIDVDERLMLERFVNGEVQEPGWRTSYDWGKILFKLQSYTHYKLKWAKLASCVIDLEAKYVYFT
jgi:hypothetical protein